MQWLLLLLQRGVLRGFESAKVAVNFAPTVQQVYNARAALLLLPPDAVTSDASTAAAIPIAAEVGASASILSITAAGLEESGQQAADVATAAADVQRQQQQSAADSSDAEKLILTIVGEATKGALSVEPSTVSFGVVNVGYPQHKTLSLINQSHGVLRYSVELLDDSPEEVERDTAACEFAAPTAALLAGAGGAAGGRGCLQDCWVDEADGIVNARWVEIATVELAGQMAWCMQRRMLLCVVTIAFAVLHAISLAGCPGCKASTNPATTCSVYLSF